MDVKSGIINLINIGAISDYKTLDRYINKAIIESEITEADKNDIYAHMNNIMISSEELLIKK